MLQDSSGFMWFATAKGLSRFDGTIFKNFYATDTGNKSLQGSNIDYRNIEMASGIYQQWRDMLPGYKDIEFYETSTWKGKYILKITRSHLHNISSPG